MSKFSAIILNESAFFNAGQILQECELSDGGIKSGDKFIEEGNFILLNEDLSPRDEKRIREIIRKQLRDLFYNLYTKNSFIIGS